MNVVGLDLSLTATGVASAAGTEVLSTSLRGCERLAWVREEVICRMPPWNDGTQDHLVVLEGYAYGRPNQAHQIGELGGVIRLALHEAGIPWVEVPPATLKKLATGKGNGTKDAVLAAAIRRLDFQGDNNNEADAAWLREAALIHYGLSAVDLPAGHLSALDKIAWPELPVAA